MELVVEAVLARRGQRLMKRLDRLLTSAFLLIALLALGSRAAHAQATFVAGSETHNSCSGATCGISIYASVANDQLVILNGTISAAGTGVTGLPGWMTCSLNNGSAFHCYGVWTTGDATSFNLTTSASGNWTWGTVLYQGEDPVHPVDPYGTVEMAALASWLPSIPAISPAYLNEVRIGFFNNPYGFGGGLLGTPTGFTTRSANTPYPYEYIFEQTLSTTTPVGDALPSSGSSSGVTEWGGGLLIRPASATAGTQTPTPYIACNGLNNSGSSGTAAISLKRFGARPTVLRHALGCPSTQRSRSIHDAPLSRRASRLRQDLAQALKKRATIANPSVQSVIDLVLHTRC